MSQTQIKFVGDQILFAGDDITFNEECCCCGCTVTQWPNCQCLDEDFGAFQAPKSVQVDVDLTPVLRHSAATYNAVSNVCGPYPPTLITCPSVNGSYVLSPAYMNDLCRVYMRKRVSSFICTAQDYPGGACSYYTPRAGTWNLLIISTISVSADLVGYVGTPQVSVEIGSYMAWVHADTMGSVNQTVVNDNLIYLGPRDHLLFPGCGYGASTRRVYFTFSSVPEYKYYTFVPSSTCLPSCNSIDYGFGCSWGSYTVEDFPDVEWTNHFGSMIPIYGCSYNGSSITAAQV